MHPHRSLFLVAAVSCGLCACATSPDRSAADALACVLTASGAPATARQVRPLLHVTTPQSLPYRFGRLTYQVAPDLAALQSELDQKHSVLVQLQRRYLIVTDYDPQSNTMVVRAGDAKPWTLSAYEFAQQWERSQRWAMLVLRPGELPAELSRERYFEAAAAFEREARPDSLLLVFDAALQRWRDEPLAWAGRATAKLRGGNLIGAARDYTTSLRIDGSNSEVRHDLALTLLYLGCTHKAQSQIDKNRVAQEPALCAEFSF